MPATESSELMTDIPSFPITPHLEEICTMLKDSPSRCLVLTAETGAGKSTVFPLALLERFAGKIFMTQPRRLSAIAVARRISDLLGEECGKTCGYKIHLENRTSSSTRLTVMTENVLVRMLQSDPALEDSSVIIIDEFHERTVATDLNLAFLKDALALRDDLFLVIMSATMDAKKIAVYLADPTSGKEAPVYSAQGRTFPVEINYDPSATVQSKIMQVLSMPNHSGNILAFLPGIYEISKCADYLKEKFKDDSSVQVHTLHSSVSMEEQKKVLSLNPVDEEKSAGITHVIISSAIAETSLTVPGVTCVIDSGLSRLNTMDISSGMQKLVTVPSSDFSSTQRAGRAGRIMSGSCWRLWSKNDIRPQTTEPEIRRSDLSQVVLECAQRGTASLEELDFLDPPSPAAWKESSFLLEKISMIDEKGNITAKGKAALILGTNPRLAGILLSAGNDPALMEHARKLYDTYGPYSASDPKVKSRAWTDIKSRLENVIYIEENPPADKTMLLLSGFADRLAMHMTEDEYMFASGKTARISGPTSSVPHGPQWIIAPETSASPRGNVIRSFEKADGTEFQKWLTERTREITECTLDTENSRVTKSQNLCYGRIIISSRKLPVAPEDTIAAWKNLVSQKGLDALPLNDESRSLILRRKFFLSHSGESNSTQDASINLESKLAQDFSQWLEPFLGANATPDGRTVFNALSWYLDAATLGREVPEQIILPNGNRLKIAYEKSADGQIRPVAQIIIQRAFGCFETPRIMGVPVLLHLLSPARRPLQITQDLENFWTTTWPQICKEMKGRYPKHNWDYRVAQKE